ncbi:MAG: hypothetical protein KBA15_01135 [Spirochaetes bacterium]|jgi:hypothetical protein|nr:hypothetical protein [Spirochaetota bacterium]
MKKKKKARKKLLKSIRAGIRLNTPPPKTVTPETVYNRKKNRPVEIDGLYLWLGAPEKVGLFNGRRREQETG